MLLGLGKGDRYEAGPDRHHPLTEPPKGRTFAMKTTTNLRTRSTTIGARRMSIQPIALLLIGLLLAGTASPAYSLAPPIIPYEDAGGPGSGAASDQQAIARPFFDDLHTAGDLSVAVDAVYEPLSSCDHRPPPCYLP